MHILLSFVCMCALLPLQRCASLAESADCELVHISGVAGDHRSFTLKLDGGRYGSPYYHNFLYVPYGETLIIYCSGSDSKNLNIELPDDIDHGTIRPTEIVNTTTHMLVVENLGINYGEYKFTCTNVETTCAAQLFVDVRPVITIISPNVRQKPFEYGMMYWVPVAEEYEVTCSGNPILSITDPYPFPQTISVNESTIKSAKLRENESKIIDFTCARSKPHPYAPSGYTAYAQVHIGYPPAATDFRCVEFLKQINCTWDVLSTETTFTLTYTYSSGNSMRIYENYSGTKKTMRCEWSLENVWRHGLGYHINIYLVMTACNFFYCSNQSYFIDRLSIVRVKSPQDLKPIKITTHSVVLKWDEVSYKEHIPMEYKITYRMQGTEQELDASSLRGRQSYREIELKLPCPGALYRLQVYVKHSSTPQSNEYWSEPATIAFHTEPQESGDAVHPVCNKDPELIDNKYVAVYDIKKFRRSYMKETLSLQEKVSDLKRKLDKIKRFCLENNMDQCINK